MVYRNSWLAGLAALAFAVVQLDGLIQPTVEGVAWQYLVIAALALGITITWTALTYRLKVWLVVVINAAAALIAVVRVATPATTTFLLPTRASFEELGTQLDIALGTIRTGVEPIAPEAGIVVVLMLLLWAVGGLLSWGLLRGHPYVALLPPLVLALQFATMNRRPTSALTIGAFVALVALVLFAITSDDRDHTSGRMAPRGEWASTKNRPGPAAAGLLAITVLGSAFAVNAVDDVVPHDGVLSWRVNSGGLPGDVPGGRLSYNPFIDIHQDIVRGSETRAFIANIASEGIEPDDVYFRFMTLGQYDGQRFSIASNDLLALDEDVWESPGHQFAGPTEPLAAMVAIDQLDMPWLPTPATPFAVQSIDDDFDQYLGVRPEDGAVYYANRSRYGMIYRVDANIPVPDLDVLATNQLTGELSIAFRQAIDNGDIPAGNAPRAATVPFLRPDPPDAATYLELPGPSDEEARITDLRRLAVQWTEGLETEYEKGLALEAELRKFDYTTDIVPGEGATDLYDWLLVPTSPNYQRGYCENFSTAMAVLARTLGIHSRVVLGFTPGQRDFRTENGVEVRDRNAHAWVELWMPSQGWVRFDPTPRSDTVVVDGTSDHIAEQLGTDNLTDIFDVELAAPEEGGGGFVFDEGPLTDEELFIARGNGVDPEAGDTGLPMWIVWGAIGVLVAGIAAALIPYLRRLRHRARLRRLRSGDISAAWEDILLRLEDLGRPVRTTDTPSEVADSVAEAMTPLATVYARSIYGPPEAEATEADIAAAETSLAATRSAVLETATRRRRLTATYGSRTLRRRLRRRAK